MIRHTATVVPMVQLEEIIHLYDCTGMMVRTMISQFFQNRGIVVRRKLRKNNNTFEFNLTLKQDIRIPKLNLPGIKSSDSIAHIA